MNFPFNLFWISETFLLIFLNFKCIKKLSERTNSNTNIFLCFCKKYCSAPNWDNFTHIGLSKSVYQLNLYNLAKGFESNQENESNQEQLRATIYGKSKHWTQYSFLKLGLACIFFSFKIHLHIFVETCKKNDTVDRKKQSYPYLVDRKLHAV